MILLNCIIPSITFASVPGSCSAYTGTSLLVHHVLPWGFFICLKNICSKWHRLSEMRVRSQGRTEISNKPAAGNYFTDSGTNYSVSLGATVQHRISPFHRTGEKDQSHHGHHSGEAGMFWCNKLIWGQPRFFFSKELLKNSPAICFWSQSNCKI